MPCASAPGEVKPEGGPTPASQADEAPAMSCARQVTRHRCKLADPTCPPHACVARPVGEGRDLANSEGPGLSLIHI
eukprot:5684212-Alexandrium_andersonii.AAC.1